jgi:CelD/BcsL family acetyltransferase involved in cellulose biosynthesis
VLYEELAPSQGAMPRLVVVTERNTGEIALILPLVIRKKRTLTVASFADLGVSDYGGPILGPAVLKNDARSGAPGAPFVERCVASISLVSSACPHKSANCLIR